jgi:hypothetical protein
MSGIRIQPPPCDDEHDLDEIEVEPDDPDQWRDCAEDHETERNERADHEGWPPF